MGRGGDISPISQRYTTGAGLLMEIISQMDACFEYCHRNHSFKESILLTINDSFDDLVLLHWLTFYKINENWLIMM